MTPITSRNGWNTCGPERDIFMTTAAQLVAYDETHQNTAHTHPDNYGGSVEEKNYLYNIIRLMRPRRVLEVGVNTGNLTCWLALALEHNGTGELVSVDWWKKTDGGFSDSPVDAQKRLSDNGLLHRVQFVSADSHVYLKSLPDNCFDFCWIDGDHSFAGAKLDVIEALRLSSTGVVGVHDTDHLPEVRAACNSISQEIPWAGECVFFKGWRGIGVFYARKG
jgi:predicted O-methyltransferase YrrM